MDSVPLAVIVNLLGHNDIQWQPPEKHHVQCQAHPPRAVPSNPVASTPYTGPRTGDMSTKSTQATTVTRESPQARAVHAS